MCVTSLGAVGGADESRLPQDARRDLLAEVARVGVADRAGPLALERAEGADEPLFSVRTKNKPNGNKCHIHSFPMDCGPKLTGIGPEWPQA